MDATVEIAAITMAGSSFPGRGHRAHPSTVPPSSPNETGGTAVGVTEDTIGGVRRCARGHRESLT